RCRRLHLMPCCLSLCSVPSHAFALFFFQAEDGIRDRNVTGVQTCALPICGHSGSGPSRAPAHAEWADSSSLGWNSPASTSRYSRESSLRLKYEPPPLTRIAASTTSFAVSVARTFAAERRGNHRLPWSANSSTSLASASICG